MRGLVNFDISEALVAQAERVLVTEDLSLLIGELCY